MGGYGSGWRGARKATVESSLVLSINSLVRKKAIVPGARTSGSLDWTDSGNDKPHASVGYEANLVDLGSAWLRLHYQANNEPVDYRIKLVTTTPRYGGLRWWFICPLDGPQRRVAKLYLPPGAKHFGGREGHGLTYTSCQESGKERGLFRHLAAATGMDEESISQLLKD